MAISRQLERTVFFGTPEFAVPVLDALDAAGRRPLLVVSQPPRRTGRGRRVVEPPVARWALERGVELLQPNRLRDAGVLDALAAFAPDLAVVAAYGRIFPASLLALPAAGCVNIHASLLPAYRGAAPIQAAIAAGEEFTGVTTMLMDEGLDTGPILMAEQTRIGPRETAGELSARLALIGARLLIRTIEQLEASTVDPAPQCDQAATYAPMLSAEDGIVDWRLPAREIACRVRAFEPWPGSRTSLRDEPVRILAVRSVDSRPGRQLASVSGDDLVVAGAFLGCAKVEGIGRTPLVGCGGSSVLALERVQRPGRRPVSGIDFVNGLRLAPGERFGMAA